MSEIPFFDALGDALDAAVAAANERRAHRRLSRFLRPPRRAAVLLVGLVLAGGAAAQTLIGGGERLAAGRIDCFYGPTRQAHGFVGLVGGGLSPSAACRQEYRASFTGASGPPATRYVACRKDSTDVAVFWSDGHSRQCQRLGYEPLGAMFALADKRVRFLSEALMRLQGASDCVASGVLASEVHAALTHSGFLGWRPVITAGSSTSPLPTSASKGSGTCGRFIGRDPYLSLDASRRTVIIEQGPPASVERLVSRVGYRLVTATASKCFTIGAIRAAVLRSLVGSPLRARFAVTGRPPEPRYEPRRQRSYDRGCVMVNVLWPASGGHAVFVWLNAHRAQPLRPGEVAPATADFKP